MTITIRGVVKEGRIVPDAPLPEGAHVEIRLVDSPPEVPEEYGDEVDRAFDLATNAMDAAFERGDLTPDKIYQAIREFRARHPYQQ